MRTGFLALVFGLMLSFPALTAPFIYTHTTSAPEHSYKLAATWFLPDWQDGMARRTQNDYGCSNYGLYTSVPANATCKSSNPIPGNSLTCYSACVCKSGYILAGSSISAGCKADCGNYTLGTAHCLPGQTVEYCRADQRYFRCTGTACPSTVACDKDSHCTKTANDIQSGCGNYCAKCELCPTETLCNNAKCAAYTSTEGCKEVCSKCCPSSIGACSNGCKTYSSESGCTDVCIECKIKSCDQPEGSCWQLNGSSTTPDTTTTVPTPLPTPTPVPTPTPTPTPTPVTSPVSTTTQTISTTTCITPLKVYMESQTEKYTNDCGYSFSRPCITTKSGYGWNEVSIDKTIFKDNLTATPSSPTGETQGSETLNGLTASYEILFEEFASCEKYYHRDCKLYNRSEGFSPLSIVWNEYNSNNTDTLPTPTTPCIASTNSYNYPAPYQILSDVRDSGCGWSYSRCCYIPTGNDWKEIPNTSGQPTTSIPSTIPSTPSSCSTLISGEYMSWDNNQPINCSGTIKFNISCDGIVYFKCVYDGSSTTSLDVTNIPAIITGITLKPIKPVGKYGLTTTTQTLSSCGKSYQRTCQVPTSEGLYHILNFGETSTDMVTSCGINYAKTPTTTCTVQTFPNCSGGTWFHFLANNNCLSYRTCTPPPTPTDPTEKTCLLNHDYMVEALGWTSGSSRMCMTGQTMVSAISCDGKAVSKCLVDTTSPTNQASISCQTLRDSYIRVSSTSSSQCNRKCYNSTSSGITIEYFCDDSKVEI